MKLKVGVFKFTSCSGCQVELIRMNEQLPELLNLVEFKYWAMASSKLEDGPYDLALVEGAISTPECIEEVKAIREKSRVLVALGDCAVTGGVPSIRNWMSQREAETIVYPKPGCIRSTRVYGIDEYVKVDYYLKGCPPRLENILEVFKAVILGVKPRLRQHPVCVECKFYENECLLTTYKQPCMGPVTAAGCGAICPNVGRVCEGCYGPMSDPNIASMVERLKEIGLSDDEILRKFRKYAGMSKLYREVAKL
ncbi:MAG: NADH:ubiquinone oxidoreductase-like, 20kDa subunit [Candidatus Bathyarchaeota archaeon B24]|nr:MAG: NADH:ubiquinone oxidoreductase-like, 20kDa subunit [Candidatus Bathyarchaeota archaeon B24]